VTIPATVPQGSEIPEGLMNSPVHVKLRTISHWKYVAVSTGFSPFYTHIYIHALHAQYPTDSLASARTLQ
jgi:hypothetical protein